MIIASTYAQMLIIEDLNRQYEAVLLSIILDYLGNNQTRSKLSPHIKKWIFNGVHKK